MPDGGMQHLFAIVDFGASNTTFSVLKDMRVVTETHMGGGEAIFEWVPSERHHHLICRQCGLIKDITLDKRLERTLDTAFDKLATDAGFQPDHHDIDVFGTCADCAQT